MTTVCVNTTNAAAGTNVLGTSWGLSATIAWSRGARTEFIPGLCNKHIGQRFSFQLAGHVFPCTFPTTSRKHPVPPSTTRRAEKVTFGQVPYKGQATGEVLLPPSVRVTIASI